MIAETSAVNAVFRTRSFRKSSFSSLLHPRRADVDAVYLPLAVLPDERSRSGPPVGPIRMVGDSTERDRGRVAVDLGCRALCKLYAIQGIERTLENASRVPRALPVSVAQEICCPIIIVLGGRRIELLHRLCRGFSRK